MLNKNDKISKIYAKVDETGITAYELSKKTGLNESGLNRFLKKEVKNPHKTTIDALYAFFYDTTTGVKGTEDNYSTSIDTLLNDGDVNAIVRYLLDNNEELMKHSSYKQYIKGSLKFLALEEEKVKYEDEVKKLKEVILKQMKNN